MKDKTKIIIIILAIIINSLISGILFGTVITSNYNVTRCSNNKTEFLLENLDGSSNRYKSEHVCRSKKYDK